MKLRPRKIALLVVGSALVAVGFWLCVNHYRAKWAVAAYKKQLIAAGEKLTIAELVPPPVPYESNSAGIFLQAARLNTADTCLILNSPSAMHMIASGKAMVGSARPNIVSGAWLSNSWEEADAALAQYADALELFHQIIEHPALDFAPAYQQGFSVSLPHLSPMLGAAQRLSAAALCHSHRGDAASAVTDVRAMLALVKGLERERFIISQLVRISIASYALSANWELLQSPNLADAQLAALQRDWTEVEFVGAGENALAMDRAVSQAALVRMRDSSANFRQMTGSSWRGGAASTTNSGSWFDHAEVFAKTTWERTRNATKEGMWRVAWSYPDELNALKGSQALLDALRLVQTNGFFLDALRQEKARLDQLHIKPLREGETAGLGWDADWSSIFSRSVLSLEKLLYRYMSAETSRQMAVTAIALKRYQLRHGNYPPDLAALAPEFLPAVPRDPVDGKPLRYHRNADGTFLLYSVGADGEDNGGDPQSADNPNSVFWQNGRDWVWPQPATLEEIQAYYSKKAKR